MSRGSAAGRGDRDWRSGLSADGGNPDAVEQEIRDLHETVAELERQVAESRRVAQRLAVRDAVTGALAQSSSLFGAAPRILRTVCETLEWQLGALWTVEPHLDLLRCVEIWHASADGASAFEAATRQLTFGRGVGMPGRVWASSQPAWISDVTTADNFPRALIAAQEGLRACLGFPIAAGPHCVGVMEFFSREIREPDQELLDMLAALGSQIGQFVERKHAEQELDRYFMLSLDMLCIASFAGYFIRVNPAWERTLGYSAEEMTASPFIEFIHPEDRPATLAEMESLSKGEDTVSFENRYRAKDGSYRWMLWNATPFVEEQVIYAAARDITGRKRDEEKILRLREEAEAANRAKSEFLARMSHEIRTPLNVVIGMGDVLERTALNTEQRQYVRVFQKAGGDLLTLINDLLDLSKVESGRIVLEEVDFNLADLTETVVEIMSLRAQQKRIELRSEIVEATPARLRGDPDRLRQVLINLVANAIKFTDKGRVVLRVEPDPERTAPGALRFSVADTGIGIPPEKLNVIFEAFAQADASTTRKYGGTGLGLAIAKRLVEVMNGRIWAESQPGGGATFYFTAQFGLAGPAILARSESLEESQPPQPPNSFSGLRILVADDSEENRFLVAEYLKDLGCEIESAEDGQAAVEKFCSGAYGLVLMDLQMPIMDGFAATRRIRGWEEEQSRPPTPILALTASALSGELQHALDAGCTAYLRKPVRLLTLLEAVGKYAPKVAAYGTASPTRIQVRADARLRAVIPEYLQNRRGDVGAIQEALGRFDYDTIRALGHKMSGSGSSYGFERITEIGQALENSARERNVDAIRAQVGELSTYLDQVEVV
jgi:PAS domain S-box-containing protein